MFEQCYHRKQLEKQTKKDFDKQSNSHIWNNVIQPFSFCLVYIMFESEVLLAVFVHFVISNLFLCIISSLCE